MTGKQGSGAKKAFDIDAALGDALKTQEQDKSVIDKLKDNSTKEEPAKPADKAAAKPDQDAMKGLQEQLGNVDLSGVSDERMAGFQRMMADFQNGLEYFEQLPEDERAAMEADFEANMHANMEQMMAGGEMTEMADAMAQQLFGAESVVPWMSKVVPRYEKFMAECGGEYNAKQQANYRGQIDKMKAILKHYADHPEDTQKAFQMIEELNAFGDMPEKLQARLTDIFEEMGIPNM